LTPLSRPKNEHDLTITKCNTKFNTTHHVPSYGFRAEYINFSNRIWQDDSKEIYVRDMHSDESLSILHTILAPT